eukprot:scaffold1741_cov409-Prasinococcus_capsulatus_cf.AAC.15
MSVPAGISSRDPTWPLDAACTGFRQARWIFRKGAAAGLAYNHMAMMEALPNGTLAAAWQAAEVIEGGLDMRIWFAFSEDPLGREWAAPRQAREDLVDVPSAGAQWAPVLHFDTSTGKLWLFYAESRDCIRPAADGIPLRWVPGGDIKATTTQTGCTGSTSDQWTEPQLIWSQDADTGVPKVIANKLTVLKSGEWVLPSWKEVPRAAVPLEGRSCSPEGMKPSAGVLFSSDKGETWEARGALTHSLTWLIENTAVQLQDGSLLMFFRSWAGQIFQSLSFDKGWTWSSALPTGLPNPDAKIHLMRLEGSPVLALAFNDHQKYHDDGYTRFRTKLRVGISEDEGRTWSRIAELDEEDLPGWQYHYPTMVQVGCKLLVAYSKSYDDGELIGEDEEQLAPSVLEGIRLFEVDL